VKAVRLHGPRSFRTDDVPEPSPGPGEVKIAVRSVGVCASDVHYFLHGRIGAAEAVGPFILGHEFSGVVEQVGEGASAHLRPGQAVTAEPVRPCGTCPSCLRGEYNVCPNLLFFGTPPQDGCLCQHVVCLARFTFPLPQGVSLDEGAMTEPLAVGVEAAAIAGPLDGASCLVIGAGAIGLSAVQALRAGGARSVAALEPIAERRAAALELGALAAELKDAEATARLLGPDGPDVVVEAAGEPDAPQLAVDLVRPGGTVVLAGIPEQDLLSIRASTPRRKGLTIRFVRRYRHRFATALGLLAAGRANVGRYVTHIYGPEQTAEAFDLTATRRDGIIRAVIRF